MKKELYYVTSNPGKFAEVAEYIAVHEPSIVLRQCSADIEEIQSLDQRAIAVDKAKKAWTLLQKPLLIDDAGIYFEKYYKFPGTMSKFAAQGLGFDGIARIIDEGDVAFFLLYMVYVDAPHQEHIFEGMCKGSLTKPNSLEGDIHLPFDIFFKPNGAQCTYALLRKDFDQFAHFNYRIQALKTFLAWYKQRL